MSQNLYVSNWQLPTLYVMPTLTTGWAIANFGATAVELCTGLGELADAAEGLEILSNISTAEQLFDGIAAVAKLVYSSAEVWSDSNDAAAAAEALASFKQLCIQVPDGSVTKQSVDVLQTGGFDYLQPSAIAGLFDASTINLAIFNNDLTKSVTISTSDDAAWVVTSAGVTQAAPGHTWVEATGVPTYPLV